LLGIYEKVETFETNAMGSFISVSDYLGTGWIDNGSCRNPNNGKYSINPGCEQEPQQYEYLTTICTEEIPKAGVMTLYYHYSNTQCYYQSGSSCNFNAEIFAKKGNEYFSLGATESTYTASKFLNTKYFYENGAGEISNLFTNNCLALYIGKYWWYRSDGVTSIINLDRVQIEYNPVDCSSDEDCEDNFVCNIHVCEEAKVDYFILENNKCSNIQAKPSEKLDNYYDTLDECKENIDSKIDKNLIYLSIFIVISIVLLVIKFFVDRK
jgi:hypothetical protein